VTAYGTWVSYSGAARVWLAILLVAVGVGLAYGGTRLRLPVRARRPGKAATASLLMAWVLAIASFLICAAVYVGQVRQKHLTGTPPTDPITLVTLTAVVATFAIINEIGQPLGQRTALASAVIGALCAPMIFELPFDLIVMARTYPRSLHTRGCTGPCSSFRSFSWRSAPSDYSLAHGGVVQQDSVWLGCDVRRLRDLGPFRLCLPVCPDPHRAELAVKGPGVRRRHHTLCASGIRCRRPARQGAWTGQYAGVTAQPRRAEIRARAPGNVLRDHCMLSRALRDGG
jgi:hypothetical protein